MYSELILRLKRKSEEDNKHLVICSNCGNEMIKRKSKFGDGFWWGCSNFPKCRNTLK